MLVRTHVVTPTKLTKAQKDLLAQLAETLGTPDVPEHEASVFDRIRNAFS